MELFYSMKGIWAVLIYLSTTAAAQQKPLNHHDSLSERTSMELQFLLLSTALLRICIRPPSTVVQHLFPKWAQHCALRDPALDEAVPWT